MNCIKCGREYSDDLFKESEPCHLCRTKDGSDSADEGHDLNPGAQADESQGTLGLAIDVFRRAAQATPENLVLSPDGLFQTLSLILMGATDETQQLLQKCLGEDYSEPTGATASGATASGATACGQDQYCIANCLLVSNRHTLQETYKKKLEQINADIRDNVNFSDRASLQSLAQELNDLFCQLTHGLVREFCQDRDWHSSTSIALINSVYFKGFWETAFRKRIGGSVFTLPDNQKVVLDGFMDGEINAAQEAEYNDWRAATVPYQGDHEMILILPPEGIMPHEVSPEIIMALFSSLDSKELSFSSSTVPLGLPTFSVDSDTNLINALAQTTLHSLFTGALSLGSMLSNPVPVFINVFNQHSVIEVNEQGTEAAAVTHVGFFTSTGMSSPKPINFTRPFIYILRNKITKKIIFIGQILDPRNLKEDSSGSASNN
ncbi:serpin family protein [Endozoicomonas sp. 8E]|uniref:serpin family protein n=1 Tax=Endozoicomonas sp. 8E TaxID=3035692 RepID=UPI002939352D|nr:serpin family protein [Endozoicomonas sp. 8E]WOG25605.1 serpin family protein [Endozoicomonas sp. 8E]